jgi:predicted site-specific integrase-resolvase
MSILDFIPSTTTYQDLRPAMKIGYARISTKKQNLNLQVDALKKVGCTLIHQETGVPWKNLQKWPVFNLPLSISA